MPLTVIRARREIKGNTQRNYIVFIEDGMGLADFRGLLFTLNAIQFRRDRLKLVIAEYTNTSHFHAQNMREWLEPRWGKGGKGDKEGEIGIGYVDLNPKDAPPETFPQQLAKRDKHDLEPRYNEAAHLIAMGKNDAEIAKLMEIKKSSAYKYRKDIAIRFDVSSMLTILVPRLRELGYGEDRG